MPTECPNPFCKNNGSRARLEIYLERGEWRTRCFSCGDTYEYFPCEVFPYTIQLLGTEWRYEMRPNLMEGERGPESPAPEEG